MSEVIEENGTSQISDKVTKRGTRWLRSKHSTLILAGISFAESVFVPIIIDPFIIALVLASPKKWKWYVFVSVGASILGGIVAYILGILFFDTIGASFIGFYGLEGQFASISENLNNNGFVFVLLGAFTPIPYKIVAISSGLLHINFLTFIVASIFGRALRLGLVGFAAYAVGPKALPTIQKHLYLFAAIIGLMLLIYILIRIFF